MVRAEKMSILSWMDIRCGLSHDVNVNPVNKLMFHYAPPNSQSWSQLTNLASYSIIL